MFKRAKATRAPAEPVVELGPDGLPVAASTQGSTKGGAKSDKQDGRSWVERYRRNLIIIGVMLAVMWGLEIIDMFLGGALDGLGIRPRQLTGLTGLVMAPFLHGDFVHLVSNTIPFAVLSFIIMMRGTTRWATLSVFVSIVGGACVWLIGASNSVHIGASGLIFGYLGYSLAAGWWERSFKSIIVALVVLFLYGSTVFGVLPGRPGVSWESHMFGAIAGVAFAYLTNRKLIGTRKRIVSESSK